MNSKLDELARLIDHTNLKPYATRTDIKKLCNEARNYHFWSVCVNPYYVDLAKQFLKNTDIKVCTVIGFPLGATTTETKVFEAKHAIKNGADELDMVINIGALKNKEYEHVKNEIAEVVVAADGHLVKVILETCYLEVEEIKKAATLAKEAQAHFVKTSTGFGTAGATIEHVKLLHEIVGKEMGVKASGGIRTYETANQMIKAGATRLGTSSSVKIMEEYKKIVEK